MLDIDYASKYKKYKKKYATVKALYDYVIVGGGSAGCVLASRLSENPKNKVLLLEAGPNFKPGHFPKELTNPSIIGTDKYDWHYRAIKSKQLAQSIELPRARVMGGCSSHNATAAIRATCADFENWSSGTAASIHGWSFNDMLPYYKKLERTNYGSDLWHGRSGPIPITLSSTSMVGNAFIQACTNLGYQHIDDFNNGSSNGAGISARNIIDNIRQNTAITYLNSTVRLRPNLKILGETEVDRVIPCALVPDQITSGSVITTRGNIYQASKEIILCAGTVGSACILLRSGIGPKNELEKLGIPVITDLPVGKTLYDHPFFYSSFKLKHKIIDDSSIGTLLWTRSKGNTSSIPNKLDIQIVAFLESNNVLTLGIALTEPISVGTLKIPNKFPDSKPIIDLNFMDKSYDAKRLVEAVRLARSIVATEPLAQLIRAEVVPGDTIESDKAIAEYLRNNIDSFGHICGSTPLMKVVDEQCRVYNVNSLRVVDASIFPKPISCPTNLTVIAIAEKIANDIMQDNSFMKHSIIKN